MISAIFLPLYRCGATFVGRLEKMASIENYRHYCCTGTYFRPKIKKHPCRKPKRGLLPWEEALNRLEKEKKSDCNECPPPGLLKKMMSVYERRKFAKCKKDTKDPSLCKEQECILAVSKKEYPMVHAVQKNYIPGCPTPDWQELLTKSKPDLECS